MLTETTGAQSSADNGLRFYCRVPLEPFNCELEEARNATEPPDYMGDLALTLDPTDYAGCEADRGGLKTARFLILRNERYDRPLASTHTIRFRCWHRFTMGEWYVDLRVLLPAYEAKLPPPPPTPRPTPTALPSAGAAAAAPRATAIGIGALAAWTLGALVGI